MSKTLHLTGGGGENAISNSFVQTDCIVGQGIISARCASIRYAVEPTSKPPFNAMLHERAAAKLWGLFE